MSRRMIAMMAGAVVIVAGAITLAVMTRSTRGAVKVTIEAAREIESLATSEHFDERAAAKFKSPHDAGLDDGSDLPIVAGDGNGSTGASLQRLVDEYAQHHWANAIAQCLNPEVAIAGAKACAISACELHDAMHARMYLRARRPVRIAARSWPPATQAHVPLEHAIEPLFGPHHRPFRSPDAGSGG